MLSIVLVFADYITKFFSVVFLKPVGSIKIAGEFFKLTYAENTGAAFSQFQGQNQKLYLLTIIFLIILLIFIRNSKNKPEFAGYFMIFSGALGNLIDRLFRGHVIDFIDFDFINIKISPFLFFHSFELNRWPVFNFADSYIFLGSIFVIISFFLPEKKD